MYLLPMRCLQVSVVQHNLNKENNIHRSSAKELSKITLNLKPPTIPAIRNVLILGKERPNRSANNRDMVDKAKCDIVSEYVTSINYREAGTFKNILYEVSAKNDFIRFKAYFQFYF